YSIKYKNYWKENKRKIVEGYWVNDGKGLYQWLPPVLALYNNFWTIEMEKKGSKSQNKVKGTPNLRDLEWIKGFIWAYARGFSGFEKEDKYTCHRLLDPKRIITDPDFDLEEELEYIDSHIKQSLYKKDGSLKEYKFVLEYLYEYKDRELGKPQFFNTALNVPDIRSEEHTSELQSHENLVCRLMLEK